VELVVLTSRQTTKRLLHQVMMALLYYGIYKLNNKYLRFKIIGILLQQLDSRLMENS
jgi:hypothetical protein